MSFNLKSAITSISNFNPFKPLTEKDILKERQQQQSSLDELNELLEQAESLYSDPRFLKIKKIRQEQLQRDIELLKVQITTDPKIAEIQARIQVLQEEVDFVIIIKKQIEKLKNEEMFDG